MNKNAKNILAYFVGSVLILVGIRHLIFPFFFANTIPPYLPYPLFVGLLCGWLELFLGVGILYKPTRNLCALGTLILLLCVFPANVYIAQQGGDPMNLSPEIAWVRLPIQAIFFGFAWILKKED